MLKMVDGTGIIGVDMICPLGVSTPQPPNYDKVELERAGMLVLPNSLDAPLERLELGGKTEQVQTTGAQLITLSNRTDVGDTVLGGEKWLTKISEQAYSVWNNYQKATVEFLENNSFKLSHKGGSSANGNGLELPVKIKPDTDYTLSYASSVSVVLIYAIQMDSGCNKLRETSSRNKKYTFHSEANAEWVILKFTSIANNSYVVYNVQFQEGTVATAYEPYTGGKPSPSSEYEQEVKNAGKWNEGTQKYEVDVKVTNAEQNWSKEQTLTLTSDRPITKWDRLVEQGGEIGWLYQSAINEYRGDASVAIYQNGFCFLLNNKKLKSGEGYCEELKQYVSREEKPCINFNMSPNTYAYTLNTQAIYGSTVSAIKEYLKTHPLHLAYKTETTEFVPLPQSEQNAIRALKTYYPTTVITVDGGELDPDIKVTYRKEI